jgi:hypothetical protein
MGAGGIPETMIQSTFSVNRSDQMEEEMKEPIKILHIDNHYRVVYILIRDGVLIKSNISLETGLTMLKNDPFDLILSEPHDMAILTPQSADRN